MSSELISIIMPAYNSEYFIAEAIESVQAQTYKHWELIIVDDGSTDRTSEIVKTYCQKDERIQYYYQNNSKQAVARNYGIEKSKGNILAFLDSDDLWLPDKLEMSLINFDVSEYDLLFTDAYYTSDTHIKIQAKTYSKMGVNSGVYAGIDALKQFVENNRIPMLTVLVKKQKVAEIGGFDSNCVPAEDYDLWIRLLKTGARFIAIDGVLSIYRSHENSSTVKDRLASDAVIKCLYKNFSNKEIINLNAHKSIKKWAKLFAEYHLNGFNENKYLIKFMYRFNILSFNLILLILFYSYLNSGRVKTLILKSI
jgi:teichuronic acid biosynthesis glycosyltransferase TuaG